MVVEITDFEGLLVIKPRIYGDSRGYFFESFNQRLFQELTGLETVFVQDNESMSTFGVIRGLHYQLPPSGQSKLVRVISGEVLDVAVDIRPGSATFGKYYAIVLSGYNKTQVFIPKGFAHGYSVLSNEAVFAYKCDAFYDKEDERGILINDPDLQIDWKIPLKKQVISAKDQEQHSFKDHIPYI
jgi:dTDP-4-dehydrorhamnose 3,5-epimerase